jgi:error-prone DNA polymerase
VGAGRPALEHLAWAGSCDALVAGDRRRALWELGAAAPIAGRRGSQGVQLGLALDVGTAPALPAIGGWEAMIADYMTTGLTAGAHPIALLREQLAAWGAVSSADLRRLAHGTTVRLAGLVVARQKPSTAKGVVFMLIEDESGTVNLILPPRLYEQERVVVRTEALVQCEGRLERHASGGGAINVVLSRLRRLDLAGLRERTPAAPVVEMPVRASEGAAQTAPASAVDDFAAVAPAAQSFASGRRR